MAILRVTGITTQRRRETEAEIPVLPSLYLCVSVSKPRRAAVAQIFNGDRALASACPPIPDRSFLREFVDAPEPRARYNPGLPCPASQR